MDKKPFREESFIFTSTMSKSLLHGTILCFIRWTFLSTTQCLKNHDPEMPQRNWYGGWKNLCRGWSECSTRTEDSNHSQDWSFKVLERNGVRIGILAWRLREHIWLDSAKLKGFFSRHSIQFTVVGSEERRKSGFADRFSHMGRYGLWWKNCPQTWLGHLNASGQVTKLLGSLIYWLSDIPIKRS